MARTGNSILVTGASTGIGQATAIAFAKNGDNVFIAARNLEGLQETSDLISRAGGTSVIILADLTKMSDIQSLCEKIEKIDVIVNIAAIWHTKDKVLAGIDYQDFTEQQILDTMHVGITAPMILVRNLLPKLAKNGKIINLSGTFENGAKGWLPYYVSKKAIEDFTIGLSQELKDKNIFVNCVSPSDTLTDAYKKFFPDDATLEKCVTSEEVANKIIELSDGKSDINGQIIVVKK